MDSHSDGMALRVISDGGQHQMGWENNNSKTIDENLLTVESLDQEDIRAHLQKHTGKLDQS